MNTEQTWYDGYTSYLQQVRKILGKKQKNVLWEGHP